jgi:hypothetical protein
MLLARLLLLRFSAPILDTMLSPPPSPIPRRLSAALPELSKRPTEFCKLFELRRESTEILPKLAVSIPIMSLEEHVYQILVDSLCLNKQSTGCL